MQVQGIDISTSYMILELIYAMIPIIIFVGLIIFAVKWLHDPYSKSKKAKTQNRVDNLKKRAASDERAERELKRILRKQKNEKKRMKTYQLWILYGILFCVVIVDVVFLIVPICLDLSNDDYVVYEGEFSIHRYHRYTRRHAIPAYNTFIGEDSEKLSHGYAFVDNVGYYEGKVVYSHRSKIVVAIVDEVPIY